MMGLRRSAIECVLKRDEILSGRFFVGPCDFLWKSSSDCKVFVVNTARSNHKGEHWVGIFKTENSEGGHYEFFDPCGRDASEYDECFVDFLTVNKAGYVFNCKQFQTGSIPPCCGHYVLYFLLSRCRSQNVLLPHNNYTVYGLISTLI